MLKSKLVKTVEKYIKNTPRKGYVKDLRVKIADISHKLKSKIKSKNLRVYVTTKSLKHMYDLRTAQEFDFIVNNVKSAIQHPLRIYKNKEGKTGDVCFYVENESGTYFYILDIQQDAIYIVSAYRLSGIKQKRKNYLEGYRLIWSWKGDLPSS